MSEFPPITDWRDGWSAFRTPGRRLEALLVASVIAAACLLCLTVAGAVAMVANVMAVEPALKAWFGWTLDSGAAQIIEGTVEGGAVGAPVFFGIVWLARRNLGGVQRMIDGWIERNGEQR